MYNGSVPPTFHLLCRDSSPSVPCSNIHPTGGSEVPALEADPMGEFVDHIFNNNHSSQDSHLAFEGTNTFYSASNVYPFYSDTYLEHNLFPTAHESVHQDIGQPSLSYPLCQMTDMGTGGVTADALEEMDHRSAPETTHVDRPALTPLSTLTDCDMVIAWSGPIHAPDRYDYSSSGPLPSLLEHTPSHGLTNGALEDGETSPGSWIAEVSPIVANETDAPPVPVLLPPMQINWREIPQRKYSPKVGNKPPSQLKAVTFSVKGVPGFNLQRALNRIFTGLDGRDNPVLENANGPVSCRLLFPGYPNNPQSSQIAVKNWKKEPAPITKSKLAHEVAKRVDQYLVALATITIDPSAGPQWKIGEGCMTLENMYLTNVSWVSRGSVQPEIWVNTGGSVQNKC